MGFCGDYVTEFTTAEYHMVRNKSPLNKYLNEHIGKPIKPEHRVIELHVNHLYPNEPNIPRV